MTTVDVRVYEPDNETLVCSLNTVIGEDSAVRQVRALTGKDSLDGSGFGEVVVDRNHPKVAELTEGRFVQVHETVGEEVEVPLAFRVGTKQDVRIPKPESVAKDKLVTVRGSTPRGVLRYGRVLPTLGLDQYPKTNRRRFGPESPELDTAATGWTSVYSQPRLETEPGKPFGMPAVFFSQWLAGEPDDPTQTVGDSWFRRPFTNPTTSSLMFLSSWDDRGAQYFHGVQLQQIDAQFPSTVWHKPHQAPAKDVAAGDYVFAARVTNDGGRSGFINETWRTGATGIISPVLFATGVPSGDETWDPIWGVWLCHMNPTGEWFTVGEILRILLAECHARHELDETTPHPVTIGSFTDTHDSNGVLWDRIEVEVDATGTLDDAATVLEAWADIDVTNTDGLRLEAWQRGGRGIVLLGAGDVPVNLRHADGSLTADTIETTYERGNDVLLEGDKGLTRYQDAGSVATHGVLPAGKVPVGSIDDESMLDRIGAEYLAPRLEPSVSRIVRVKPRLAFPGRPGDTLSIEDEPGHRIHEQSFELTDRGLEKTPAVDSPVAQRLKQSDRLIAQLIRQHGEQAGAARALDLGAGLEAGTVDPRPAEAWSWNDAEELEPDYWEDDPDNPRAWQTFTVKEASRLVGLIVKADWADQEAGDIYQATTGDTQILLLRNGLPTSPAFIATLPELNLDDPTDPKVWAIAYIMGPAYVAPGQELSICSIQNGGHINGSAEIWATKAI